LEDKEGNWGRLEGWGGEAKKRKQRSWGPREDLGRGKRSAGSKKRRRGEGEEPEGMSINPKKDKGQKVCGNCV